MDTDDALFDDLMDSWINDEHHEQQDIAAYMVAKERRRKEGTSKPSGLRPLNQQTRQRVYGFQQETTAQQNHRRMATNNPTGLRSYSKPPVQARVWDNTTSNTEIPRNLAPPSSKLPAVPTRDTKPKKKPQQTAKPSTSKLPSLTSHFAQLDAARYEQDSPSTAGARRAARKSDGGEDASAPPRSARNEESLQEGIALLRQAVEQLRLRLSEEREKSAGMAHRSEIAVVENASLAEDVEELKQDVAKNERAKQAYVHLQKSRAKAANSLRQKELQIREVRQMIRTALSRIEKLEQTTPASSPAVSPAKDTESCKGTLRDISANNAQHRKDIADLAAKRDRLVAELQRAKQSSKDRDSKEQQMIDRFERQQQIAKLEIERKFQADLDRELARLRDQHSMAQRHRAREVENRLKEERAVHENLTKKADEIASEGSSKTKALSDMRIAESTEKTKQVDAQRELDGVLKKLEQLRRDDHKEAKIADQLARNIADARRDVAAAQGRPDKDLQPKRREWERQRESLVKQISDVKSEETSLSSGLTRLEVETSDVEEQAQNAKKQSAGKSSHAAADVTAAREEKKQAEITKKNATARLDRANAKKKEMEEKDSVIQRETENLATAKATLDRSNKHNTEILERLDRAERMLAMSGLEM